jgi:hypothetical protein
VLVKNQEGSEHAAVPRTAVQNGLPPNDEKGEIPKLVNAALGSDTCSSAGLKVIPI